MDACVCTAEPSFCPPETTRALSIGCASVQNKKVKKKKKNLRPRKTESPAGHRELEAMLGPDAIFTAAFWTWELIPAKKNPVLILVFPQSLRLKIIIPSPLQAQGFIRLGVLDTLSEPFTSRKLTS